MAEESTMMPGGKKERCITWMMSRWWELNTQKRSLHKPCELLCTSWQLCTFTISIDVSEMDQVHVFKAFCCSSFCFQDWHRLAAWKMCVLEFSDCNIWRWLAGGKARWQDCNILQHRNVWIVCSEITLWYFVNIGIYGGYYRLLQRILCSSILHFLVNFVWTDHRMQDC